MRPWPRVFVSTLLCGCGGDSPRGEPWIGESSEGSGPSPADASTTSTGTTTSSSSSSSGAGGDETAGTGSSGGPDTSSGGAYEPPPGSECEYAFFASYFDADNGLEYADLRDAAFDRIVTRADDLRACGAEITTGGMLSLMVFEGGGAQIAFFNDRCAENS
jgi:hypothetical protein